MSFIEIIGDYGSKIHNLGLTMLGYNVLGYTLYSMMNKPNTSLAILNSNWDGISNLLTMSLSYGLGERFTQKQSIGMLFISIGLFLL